MDYEKNILPLLDEQDNFEDVENYLQLIKKYGMLTTEEE
jgi:hypothetical protein